MIPETEKIKLLGQTDVFGSIPLEQQKLICSKLGIKSFQAGQYFFHEGDSGDEAFILFQGKADVIKDNKVLFHLQPGDIVGEMAPISEGKRSASVKATEDVQALFLKAEALRQLAYDIPDLSFNIMRVMIKRFTKIDKAGAIKQAENITATAEIKKPILKKTMTTTCPNCHETREGNSTVCKYCGYSFYGKFLRFFVVTAFCLLILGSGAYVYYKMTMHSKVEKKVVKNYIPLVSVKKMEHEKLQLTLEKYGRVRSFRNLTVTTELQGRITRVNDKLREGYVVDENELLLKISDKEYTHTATQTKNKIDSIVLRLQNLKQQQENIIGQIQIAQEQKDLVDQKRKRNESLFVQGGISESVLLEIKQEMLTAQKSIVNLLNQQKLLPYEISVLELELADAKLQLEEAKNKIKNTNIAAPFRARIKKVYIDEKSLIAPQTPLLILEDLSYVEVPTLIPLNQIPQLLGKFTSLDDATIAQHNIVALATTMIGGEEYAWHGRVTHFEPMNEQDYTIPVIVRIKNEENTQILEPGSFVKVSLQGQIIENAFVLPRTAISEDNTVHIAAEGKLKIQSVTIEPYKNQVIVNHGLSVGDLIILRPLPFAISGTEIKVKEVAK